MTVTAGDVFGLLLVGGVLGLLAWQAWVAHREAAATKARADADAQERLDAQAIDIEAAAKVKAADAQRDVELKLDPVDEANRLIAAGTKKGPLAVLLLALAVSGAARAAEPVVAPPPCVRSLDGKVVCSGEGFAELVRVTLEAQHDRDVCLVGRKASEGKLAAAERRATVLESQPLPEPASPWPLVGVGAAIGAVATGLLVVVVALHR